MSDPNIIPHKHIIDRHRREQLLGNRSFVLWFTGLSGSGKSTLADLLEESLHRKGVLTILLDGDNVRNGLNKDLGFTDRDRAENIRRLGELCKLFVSAGVVVLSAFISPFKAERELARSLVGSSDFHEIYVKCPVEKCEERDVKGLYSKARSGLISNFTGIDSAYEEPENPELVIDTSEMSIEESLSVLENYLSTLLTERSKWNLTT